MDILEILQQFKTFFEKNFKASFYPMMLELCLKLVNEMKATYITNFRKFPFFCKFI